jgi:hypothetical protein
MVKTFQCPPHVGLDPLLQAQDNFLQEIQIPCG